MSAPRREYYTTFFDNRRWIDLPRPPSDIFAFWDDWISRGAFDGETDGYPFWSCLHQTQSWWNERQRPNVLMVHFRDLLDDLRSEVVRVAGFLGIKVADGLLDGIVEACSFAAMKANARVIDKLSEEGLKGSADSFIYKGTNGRWRGVLDEARLARYDNAATQKLARDCCAWLER